MSKQGRNSSLFLLVNDIGAKALLALIFVFYGIGPLLNLPRLLRIPSLTMLWLPTVYAAPVLFASLSLVYVLQKRRWVLDGYAVLIALIGLFGLAIGLIRGHEARYLVSDFGHMVFVVSVYIAFLNMRLKDSTLECLVRKLTALITGAYCLALGFIYVVAIPCGWGLYLGLGSEPLLLSAAFYYRTKRFSRLLLVIGLIVLSGKRGVLIALVGMLVVMWCMKHARRFSKVVFRATIVWILVMGVFLGVLFVVYPYMGSNPASKKWLTLVPWSPQFDLYKGSSGRLTEIVAAAREFATIPLAGFAGAGSGFLYPVEEWGVERRHNVHFSPMSVLSVYGWPATILFFGMLLHLLSRIYGARPKVIDKRIVWDTLFGCAAGLLIYTLFVFELLAEPLLWVSIGLLSGMARRAHLKTT